jgi:hypothetical protein
MISNGAQHGQVAGGRWQVAGGRWQVAIIVSIALNADLFSLFLIIR